MAALNDRFWAKVLFSQFIKHFRKMNDEQIVADIRQSMDDLEDLNEEGDSFGAKMVRWSMERADEPFAVAARENGKKGGRPKSARKFRNKEEFMQWAIDKGLDASDASDCWEATVERGWKDADGNAVKNMEAFAMQWCKTSESKRRSA